MDTFSHLCFSKNLQSKLEDVSLMVVPQDESLKVLHNDRATRCVALRPASKGLA